jgi:hypothetical protein
MLNVFRTEERTGDGSRAAKNVPAPQKLVQQNSTAVFEKFDQYG